MDIRLSRLFEEYDFSKKDRYDFMQIYTLLPAHKKIGAIENFEHIAKSIQSLNKNLRQEQEILFGEALASIESRLSKLEKTKVVASTKEDILHLRTLI